MERFVCDICKNDFSSKSSLQRHIKNIHEKIKPFKCEYCDFTCANKSNLANHSCYKKRRNTNNKNPYITDRQEDKILAKLKLLYGGYPKKCDAGIIDLLTDTKIIEIKNWTFWQKAIGQISAYGVYYPDKEKHIHFFGKLPHNKKMIEHVLETLHIIMTYEENTDNDNNDT